MKSKDRNFRKNVLRLAGGALYLLLFGWAGSWATSNLFAPRSRSTSRALAPQAGPGQRAVHRRPGVRAVPQEDGLAACADRDGDGDGARHRFQSAHREPGDDLPHAAPTLTRSSARTSRASTPSPTARRASPADPLRLRAGQGRTDLRAPSTRARYYESLVSYYNEMQGLDFTIGAPRTVPESLLKALGRRAVGERGGQLLQLPLDRRHRRRQASIWKR